MIKAALLVLLGICGIVMVIVGALMPNIVETAITDELSAKLAYKDDDAKEGSIFRSKDNLWSFYVYNITNPTDVLNGKAPIVQEIKVPFTRTVNKYDVVLDKVNDTVSYRSFTTYTPLDTAVANAKITTVNLAYLGASVGATGNEYLFQAGTTPQIVAGLNSSALLGGIQGQFFSSYLLRIENLLTTNPATKGVFDSRDKVATQWNDKSLSATLNANGNALYSQVAGYELTRSVTTSIVPYLWDSTKKYSILKADLSNPTQGILAWATLLQYAVGEKSPDDKTKAENAKKYVELFNIILADMAPSYGIVAQNQTKLVTVANADFFSIIQYIGGWIQNPKLFTIFKEHAGLIGMGDYAINVWTDVSNPEFMLPFVFYNYQQTATKTKIILTPAQSKLLVQSYLKNSTTSVGFVAQSLQSLQAGGKTAGFEDLDGPSMKILLDYVADYLPSEFLLKQKLGLSPTSYTKPPANTGLLVERSPLEIMHGYRDTFLALVGADYPGVFGKAVSNESQAKSIYGLYAATTVQKAGTDDDANEDHFQYVQYNNLTEFTKQTDLGKPCPNPLLWFADEEASQCRVWKETEVIKGADSLIFEPQLFSDDGPPASRMFYNDNTKRVLKFVLTEKDVKVKDVTTNEYKLDPQTFYTSKTLKSQGASEEEQAKSDRYRIDIDGFADMSTTSQMAPIWLGGPRHYLSETEQNKIKGVTDTDWTKYNKQDLETIIYVEPISGKVIKGDQRLQFNAKISKKTANGFYKGIYTGPTANSTDEQFALYPVAWVNDADVLTDDAAQTFVDDIYGNRDLGYTLQIVLIIFGVIFVFIGFGCFFRDRKAAGSSFAKIN